jgi:cytoskeletal protein RodZ
MFKRLVMLVRGLMANLFTGRSLLTEVQPLRSAKRSRAKSTPESQVAAQEQNLRPRRQSPAPTKRKSTQEAAPSTTVARKPGKKKPTARQVAMVSQSKATGSKSKTPVSKTRQPASQVQTTKQKAADSTLAGKKTTRSKTSVQTRTANPFPVRGS